MRQSVRLMHVLLLAVVCSLQSLAAVSYEETARRAARSFEGEEWANAGALYGMMLESRPDDVKSTARAVISSLMLGDTTEMPVHLMERAMAHGVSLQAVMGDVERESFDMGRARLYPLFLRTMHAGFPYMRRAIDNYLLQYYVFRNNGPMIVKYARVMLQGMEDSPEYLSDLAAGQMLCGDEAGAVATWKRILEVDPLNTAAAVSLASWYDGRGDRPQALAYYRMAYEVRPTPYVQARIAALEGGQR